MNKIKFNLNWRAAGNDAPEYFHTMADLSFHVGQTSLMKNEDIWSKTVQNSVLVSAYPLAMWLASSWWRLNWEPLPELGPGRRPPVDWRMAHELGAANHGFVWPWVLFASDGEEMKVWAMPSNDDENQSVRYLNGLTTPASVALVDFQRCVENFITTVISRLEALDCKNTDLSNLWQIIKEEESEPETKKYRRLEAGMGYDPDECGENRINTLLSLEQRMGSAALSELAPLYGRAAEREPDTPIDEIADKPGLSGTPEDLSAVSGASASISIPWKRAVAVAGKMRGMIGNRNDRVDTDGLCELLGLKTSEAENFSAGRSKATVAVPESGRQFKFILRKKHPMAKRFELARLIGDILFVKQAEGQWLTGTDLKTARQKFQKAFAAEFLCPINALRDFLQEDFSEDAYEDAAAHFQVSEFTVRTLLLNNHLIDSSDAGLPYQLSV